MKRQLLFGLGIAMALGSAFSGAALARSVYDGAWSVVIITDRGNCDRAYRYSINISNGIVSYAGGMGVELYGRVAGNGRVSVRLSAGNQSAAGSGRLAANYGGGSWQGQGTVGYCAGRWTAERTGR